MFRSLPGGMAVLIRATALGMINAPPMPDRARAMLNETKLVQNPLPRVQMTNHTAPVIKTCLWPYTAPRRPLTRTKVPCVKLNVKWILLKEDLRQPTLEGKHTDKKLQPNWLSQGQLA